MWFLKIMQLLFVFMVIWVLMFEILIPIVTRTPLFPLFRKKQESKKDDKPRKHKRK